MSWTFAPKVTSEELRKAGFTEKSVEFPKSELSCRWIARFNGVEFTELPNSWCYASNAWMRDWMEEQAVAAISKA